MAEMMAEAGEKAATSGPDAIAKLGDTAANLMKAAAELKKVRIEEKRFAMEVRDKEARFTVKQEGLVSTFPGNAQAFRPEFLNKYTEFLRRNGVDTEAPVILLKPTREGREWASAYFKHVRYKVVRGPISRIRKGNKSAKKREDEVAEQLKQARSNDSFTEDNLDATFDAEFAKNFTKIKAYQPITLMYELWALDEAALDNTFASLRAILEKLMQDRMWQMAVGLRERLDKREGENAQSLQRLAEAFKDIQKGKAWIKSADTTELDGAVDAVTTLLKQRVSTTKRPSAASAGDIDTLAEEIEAANQALIEELTSWRKTHWAGSAANKRKKGNSAVRDGIERLGTDLDSRLAKLKSAVQKDELDTWERDTLARLDHAFEDASMRVSTNAERDLARLLQTHTAAVTKTVSTFRDGQRAPHAKLAGNEMSDRIWQAEGTDELVKEMLQEGDSGGVLSDRQLKEYAVLLKALETDKQECLDRYQGVTYMDNFDVKLPGAYGGRNRKFHQTYINTLSVVVTPKMTQGSNPFFNVTISFREQPVIKGAAQEIRDEMKVYPAKIEAGGPFTRRINDFATFKKL